MSNYINDTVGRHRENSPYKPLVSTDCGSVKITAPPNGKRFWGLVITGNYR